MRQPGALAALRLKALSTLTATFALGASPAFAGDTHPHDYPDSPTFVSPAQLYRFDTAALSVGGAYDKASERQRWSGGEVDDSATSQTYDLQLVEKASPSWYWGVTVMHHAEADAHSDSATLGAGQEDAQRTATVAGPNVAYKILDQLVIGLGARLRQISESGDDLATLNLNHAVLSQGLLLKSDWYELGWAQTFFLINQTDEAGTTHRNFRETVLHLRYNVSPAASIGAIVERNPFPVCCLAASTDAMTYSLVIAGQIDAATVEGLLTHAPAFVSGSDYDVTREHLALIGHLALSHDWAAMIGLSYGIGHDQQAAVHLPTPLGLAESADMLDLERGAQLGVVRAL